MRLRQFRITAVLRTGIARLLIAGREGQAVVETSVANRSKRRSSAPIRCST